MKTIARENMFASQKTKGYYTEYTKMSYNFNKAKYPREKWAKNTNE